jgi:PAS domain S-box-containing protein
VIVVLFLALYTWVTRPLDLISDSLRNESNEPLLAITSQEDELGQIARLISSFFDQKLALVEEIVERRQAERNAHESQRALRSFVSNLAGMAYRCKYDVNRTAEYVSDGCAEITGHIADTLLNPDTAITFSSLVHPDDRESVRLAIDQAVTTRQPYKLTYRVITADHEERFVLDHGRGVHSGSGPATAVEGIIVDITNRVKAERDREHLQTKLNRAERVQALGLLAGGVAHDLNNMLAPVLNYPELILLKLPEDHPIRPKIHIIRDAAQQAVDVVQDLLTMARRGRYEMGTVDLNGVVERYLQSANFLHLTSKNPQIRVKANLQRPLETIVGSPTHLHKAIMNIVINAFDAMPKGGDLIITTEQRLVTSLADGHQIIPGDYVLLSIKDSGVGIAPEDMKKIFEPYFSRKRMGTSGTGLGLAVVYGTVKDHHGYYDIESTVGEGTNFILYFPAGRQEQSGEENDPSGRNQIAQTTG